MKTFTELKAYEQNFIESCNTGWGCGYVHIPKNHPILVKLLINENNGYYNLQIDGFSEELTWTSWNETNDFYVVGFDTAHSWNNIQNSDKNFVEQKTNELKTIVDNYTLLDAKLEVQKLFINLRTKFKDFL